MMSEHLLYDELLDTHVKFLGNDNLVFLQLWNFLYRSYLYYSI